MKIILLTIVFLMTLSACTAKYDVVRHERKKLSMTDSYLIAKPKDGKYAEINYNNSGEMTRDALFNELIILGVKAGKEDVTQKKATLLINARIKGFNMLIFPTILQWEDRATEWSGKRDRAKIQLETIDVETEKTIDNSILVLVGTWWTLGGHHPQDMVNEIVEEYFNQLFGL